MIAKGDLSKRAKISSKDEIGLLADTINKMTSTIEKNNWQKSGQNLLSKLISERTQFEDFYSELIAFLAKYLNANAGTFYIKKAQSKLFTLSATYAINKKNQILQVFSEGEGLLGEVVSKKNKIILSEIPDNYLKLDLSDGTILLKHILIFPIIFDNHVLAVLELGGIKPFDKNHLDFLEMANENIAYAINSNQPIDNQSLISTKKEENFN